MNESRIRVASVFYNENDNTTWITQPVITQPHYYVKKVNKNKKQYLDDALMTSIAGISAAMKNTG